VSRPIDVLHLGRDRVICAYDIDGVIVDPGPASCVDTLIDRPGVVQVDVREQEGARLDVPEALEQRLDAGRRARIHDQPVDLVCTDHPVSSQVHDVNGTGQSDPTIQFSE